MIYMPAKKSMDSRQQSQTQSGLKAKANLESKVKMLSYVTYASFAIAIVAILLGATSVYLLKSSPTSLPTTTINSTTNTGGGTLAGINQPLNSTQLAIINNAPNSYFETAGEMLLNGSLTNQIGTQTNLTTQYVVNGKPSVIYLGSTTCVFCGENRWAMALALSRFGQFSQLYKGYSALQDHDVPTLYWTKANLNTSVVNIGNSYSSQYINFISIEDTGPITGGFYLQSLSTIKSEINASNNATYLGAINKIIAANNFVGTPYTVWGNYSVLGADAEVFGNAPPNSTGVLPIVLMTHAQILNQFANPNNQFSWGEYAAADLYLAMTCKAINNAASACSLPSIQKLEQLNRY